MSDDLVKRLREGDEFEKVMSANSAADRIEADAKQIAELDQEKQDCRDKAIAWYRKHKTAKARVKVLEDDTAKLMLALNYFLLRDPEKPGSWMYSRNDAEDLARAVLMDRAALEGEK